jgi:DNA (cytosine-5)-methyltransferase 1
VDLFSGIGGFRLAQESIGGKCVMSSEIEVGACLTYHANFGEWPSGDIRLIRAENVPDHDILCGGFCCQTFSVAGKKQGFGDQTRGTLFFEIVRIAELKRPAAILLENVPHLLKHDGGRTFAIIRRTLEDLGYVVFRCVLNASLFGAPTSRKRIFIVAIHGVRGLARGFRFPKPTLEQVKLADVLLPDAETNQFVVRNHPVHINSDAIACAEGHISLCMIPVGQVGEGRPRQGYRVYSPMGHAVTFTRRGGGVGAQTGLYWINGRVRKLAAREMARCLGFPDPFIIPASLSYEQTRRLFGNSVAVPVVRHIAERIMEVLQGAAPAHSHVPNAVPGPTDESTPHASP